MDIDAAIDIDAAMDVDTALLLWTPHEVRPSTMHLMKTLCGIAMETPLSKPTAANLKATQPAQDSRLLCLSPELRNIIYEEVLVEAENIEIPKNGKLIRPSFLKVCQQIAEEASTIFYALNSFTSTHNSLERLPLWFARLPMRLRRSIKAINLCYETDTEVKTVAHELQSHNILEDASTLGSLCANLTHRMMSADKMCLNAVVQISLLGLDLNAFHLPLLPPDSKPALHRSQVDSTVFNRKLAEDLVCIHERAWIRSADENISFHRSSMSAQCARQCREEIRWLRKMAADTKDEKIMARLPEIISIIQG
ncbi:hypothetical protein D0865_12841 [Hortaea werneckii]|uniref:Uncharacterized protein n=1 Tax=Hortaea werneckii TaxID=91943 RepID=A0A3M7BI42_HORWE|nr:hypothetical protein D0865_12841 [Hortaea werneckii]RMY78733.1 hypothetical protein D0863_00527 [Hortaea werneckii]